MRKVVDLPEKGANQFIRFVQQNGGRLSKAKRGYFAELTDAEVSRLEAMVGSGAIEEENRSDQFS